MTTPDDIAAAADILAESDRIRYLTPRLHTEMISEVRFPGDQAQDSGIDVASLELARADLVKLDVLRRPEVMARLDEWGLGTALGSDTRERVLAGSCLAVVSMDGTALTDYARAGAAVEAVWVVAQLRGLAVQPVSPVFLYAHDERGSGDAVGEIRGDVAGVEGSVPRAFSNRARRIGGAGAEIVRCARHVGEEPASGR